MSEVFISYSWDSPEHNEKVASLTETLRLNGIDAVIDRMISQTETAINFVKMMHEAMQNHDKIIVLLSAGYKAKAEAFKGGVGEEYQLLINDIQKSPNKYILASFDGRGDDIVPFGLRGRDIVDLFQQSEMDRLLRKLLNQPEITFSPVAPNKPSFATQTPKPLSFSTTKPKISISGFVAKQQNSSLFGGIYKNADFDFWFELKNESDSILTEYAYELRVSKYLDPEYYMKHVEDEEIVYFKNVKEKLFQNQGKKSKIFRLKVTDGNIGKVLNSTITVKVFSELGTYERSMPLTEVFKIQQSSYGGDPVPLRRDLFH